MIGKPGMHTPLALPLLDGVVLNRCLDIRLLNCKGSMSLLFNISGGDACGGVEGKDAECA